MALFIYGTDTNTGKGSYGLQEVKNYIYALEYGIKRRNDLPLSLRLIKEIHRYGRFRSSTVLRKNHRRLLQTMCKDHSQTSY